MKKHAVKIVAAVVFFAFAQLCGCCSLEKTCAPENYTPSVCTNSQYSSSFGNETYIWENWQTSTNKVDLIY